jgi:hypothetical protein
MCIKSDKIDNRDKVRKVFPNATYYKRKHIFYIMDMDDILYKSTIGSGETLKDAWEMAAESDIVESRLINLSKFNND